MRWTLLICQYTILQLTAVVCAAADYYVPNPSQESDFGKVERISSSKGSFQLLVQTTNGTDNATTGYWEWLEVKGATFDGASVEMPCPVSYLWYRCALRNLQVLRKGRRHRCNL